MRVIISIFSTFICSLVIAVSVYAAPVAPNNQQVVSEADVIAASSNGEILPATVVASDLDVNAVNAPQLDQIKSALEAQLLPIPQESANVTVAGLPGESGDLTIENMGDRLRVLEAQSSNTQAQVAQINERVNLIEERLIVGGMGEQKAQSGVYSKIGQNVDRLKDRIGHKLFLILVSSVVILFLLFLGYIIFPRREEDSFPGSYSHNEPSSDKEQDFNPMEGQEGAAAKLNLARSYIEMGEGTKAQGVLYDVLTYGDDAEQEEAKKLLAGIQHPDLDK